MRHFITLKEHKPAFNDHLTFHLITPSKSEIGWMDEEGLKIWVQKVWKARPGGLLRKKSLLIWDSFRAHLVDSVKRAVKETNTDIAVIPGGLTSVLQPLDVSLNKPFKDWLRDKWTTWMIEGQKEYTAGGNVKAASLSNMWEWVKCQGSFTQQHVRMGQWIMERSVPGDGITFI